MVVWKADATVVRTGIFRTISGRTGLRIGLSGAVFRGENARDSQNFVAPRKSIILHVFLSMFVDFRIFPGFLDFLFLRCFH